jgi:predicted dehydrogenase
MVAGLPGNTMRFLICGIGSIGQRHYKNLRMLGHEAAFLRSGKSTGYNSDFVDAFLKDQQKAGNTVEEFFDADEAVETFKPDGVFVANPNAMHTGTALQMARKGMHLFIEKPVATSTEGVDELRKLVEQNHLTVMIGYNLRFHPLLKKMKEMFTSGAIGKPLSAHVEMGENIADWHPWEDYTESYGPWHEKGGGAIFCFSHDIDYLYWFLGMPEEIFSVGGKITPLKGDAEDIAKALWRLPGGAVASLHLDYWQRPHRRSFHLVGTEGSLLWDYEAQSLTHVSHQPEASEEVWNDPETYDRNDTFIEEIQNFIAAIESGSPSAIPLQEGIDVLEICLEMQKNL